MLFSVFIGVCYLVRYGLPLARRGLMWDDFRLLSEGANLQIFLKNILHTYLHFIPLMRLSYFGLLHLFPLPSLPFLTSLWILFWVSWFSFAYFRLCRLLKISSVCILGSLAFILFNPLLSEVQMWFCSSFYLVSLVLMMESLIQFEEGLKSQARFRYVMAAFFSMVAPCFWTLGYLVGPALFIIFLFERKRHHSSLALWVVLSVSFTFYPSLRLLGEFFSGHDYTGVTPLGIFPLISHLLRAPGDILLGSFGFWGRPQFPGNFFPALQLNLLTGLLFFTVALLGRDRRWRKGLAIAIFSLLFGLAIPFYFRGTQFGYNQMRWFARYYAYPLFGMGLIIAFSLQTLVDKIHLSLRVIWLGALMMVLVSFHDRMLEHFVGVATRTRNGIRTQQLAQLSFLEGFLNLARQQGVDRESLISSYHVAVVGERSFNTTRLYAGPEIAKRPARLTLDILDRYWRESKVWDTYQGYDATLLPEVGVIPQASPESLPQPQRIRVAKEPSAVSEGVESMDTPREDWGLFQISQRGAYVIYPNSVKGISKLTIDLEVSHAPSLLELSLLADGKGPEPSRLHLSCELSPCRFEIPLSRYSWIAPHFYSGIKLQWLSSGGSQIRIRELSVYQDANETNIRAISDSEFSDEVEDNKPALGDALLSSPLRVSE